MKRAAKKDANHKAIVTELERIGCAVVDTSQIKNAFDTIVTYCGYNHIIEIKNPKYLRKNYTEQDLISALSDGERKCKEAIEKAGGVYNIIANIQEAYKIIGYEGR